MQQLPANTLLHGETYKIEKVLGQGSFGITYLATHTALGKKVAIKEFFMKELNSRSDDGSITGLTNGSLSYNYGQKFKKEALNLANLDHPNIVRVTDSFDENGTFYYVMDYIDGQNLNDYIKKQAISQSEAISIIKDVAVALIYMHEQKHMLHLDLKPSNVMRRNSDGHIFLIDFGLSKHYSNDGQPETSTTIGLGTAGYAPIEQGNKAKNGEFRPTIDVYALGATLYKLLTRETPPAASDLVSDDELLVDKLKDKSVPQNLIDFIVKAMLPNVRKRIQTVRAFKEMLPAIGYISSFISGADVEDNEETVFVDNEDEETKLVSDNSVGSKHPDFNEATYIINPESVKYPTITGTKANDGDVEAMLDLGMMALRGVGVKQESDTAYLWFMKLKELGDDRGEKLISQWFMLKDKYKKTTTTTNSNTFSKTTRKSSNNNVGLWIVGITVGIILLIFSINSYKDKQAQEAYDMEQAENARIASFVNSTEDWYIDNGNTVYCMMDGQKHVVNFYGIPDGQRTLHYGTNFSEESFSGAFSGGRKSNGTLKYKNGYFYEGSFLNGVPNWGIWYTPNGEVDRSVRDGIDGFKFKGEHRNGKPYNGYWIDPSTNQPTTGVRNGEEYGL